MNAAVVFTFTSDDFEEPSPSMEFCSLGVLWTFLRTTKECCQK